MFVAPAEVVSATTSTDLEVARRQAANWRSQEMGLAEKYLTDAALADLADAARQLDDATFATTVMAVQAARAGQFQPITHIGAAAEIFREFLKTELIDGWLYVQEPDGYLHPYLVISIDMEHADRTREARIKITMEADNPTVKRPSRAPRVLYFEETELLGKAPADVLTGHRVYKETPHLKTQYTQRREQFQNLIEHSFGQQFLFTGRAIRTEDFRSAKDRKQRKVVHDIAPEDIAPLRMVTASTLFDLGEHGQVPVVTAVRVFDLLAQDYLDVNTADLTAYVYDSELKDKLVLPEDQRELLDILTSDISVFTGDIIEGKSAGNVILARGRPGVGKTLTAEVYAEIIGKPLYSIHTGSLGITADLVRQNLEEIFARAKRWDAVLLLDEADVFVLERGFELAQNAIVAEFLRTLEYYDGLLFLTTNRIHGVDEAILARCAAVIDYLPPTTDDARQIWQTMAAEHGVTLEATLVEELLVGFEGITPRDIKMVLRLALRMARHRDVELSMEVFAAAARFRGLAPQFELRT
ncbi:ATP-binding protein [Yaniella halotolerans]|uniref:ATP-binding protein n=1 Tax=Yaniella halotolerans TaxID=225453 RepID=UPI0003B35BDB|nr:ATP-binding protein [Yaniella halotolerans]